VRLHRRIASQRAQELEVLAWGSQAQGDQGSHERTVLGKVLANRSTALPSLGAIEPADRTSSIIPVRVLLTNDDGIEADGLHALRRALLELPTIELAVIAPDGNRSAMARSITTRRPLWVQAVDFDDGTVGYATDGTPVDCVRLARLGLIEGFEAELGVAG